jgi:hypothetical protein
MKDNEKSPVSPGPSTPETDGTKQASAFGPLLWLLVPLIALIAYGIFGG